MSKKPNILLITSDAHRAECYGFETPSIRTPHIDALSRQGSRFSTCMSVNAMCQAARASILTGLNPLSNGVYDNGVDLSDEMASTGFAEVLGKAGYFTGFVGKAHFESRRTFMPTGSPGNLDFPSRYDDDWAGPYKGFQRVRLAVNGHLMHPPGKAPIGQHYERWFYRDGNGDEKLRLHKTRLEPDIGAALAWNSALPPVWHTSSWTGDKAIELIKDSDDQPFCLWVSFPDPHPPFDCPSPWSTMHHPDEVRLPPNLNSSLDGKPWWHKKAAEYPTRIYDDERVPDDKNKAGLTRLAPSSETEIRYSLANYYGEIALLDHNIGRILAVLDEQGSLENTYIIVTADHGFMMGDHGWYMQNPISYEGLNRVALVASGPNIVPGAIIDEPVSSVDICPTILGWAGCTPDGDSDGLCLNTLLTGDAETRDFAYSEWDLDATRYCLGKEVELRVARTPTHKLALDLLSGDGELYDLENDPDETVNLFSDKAYTSVRDELTDMIRSKKRTDSKRYKAARVGYY